jgi:hypothetical protein
MNGLQVYINPSDTPSAQAIFYSRRAPGPYYSWQYEDRLKRWQVSRVSLSTLEVRALCKASWKAVPGGLQMRLVEHYLE